MECYPSMKRNKVLIHTTAWTKPENFMLNAKTTYSGFCLYGMFRIDNETENGCGSSGCLEPGAGGG